MRNIKFRAWDTENKEMLKVQELDFEDTFYGGRLSIRVDKYNDYFDMEDMILMQYTGLNDKNGKEIYEGDIVKAVFADEEKLEMKGIVIYVEAAACYMVIANNGDEWELGYLDEIEKIGNKWDNPELLEEGE